MDRKIWLIATLLCTGNLFPLQAKEITTSLDERVALKKLSQYWEENEAVKVKATLVEFIKKYPQSSYIDQLHAMLGDIFFSEKNYANAAESYAQIQEKEYSRKVAFHHLHSLYELEQFEKFTQWAPSFLADPASEQKEIETITFEIAEAYRALGYVATEDQQKDLFKKAIPYYEQLQRSSLESTVLVPLAHLYTAVADYPKASQAYLRRAQLDEKNREDLLFHAAGFQIHYDKKGALETFNRIFTMKGPLAEKAAYNLIVLLFQMGRYSDVIMTSVYVGETLPKEKMGLVHYYAGKALFHEKDFEGAAEMLEEVLLQKGNDDLKEGIIVSLIACAKETNDLSLCDRMIKELQTSNADQETLTAAFLIHSQLCRNQKEWSIAREDIEKLLSAYPQHKDREPLLYDIALLLMQEGQAEEGADTFSLFLKEYPTSVHRNDALRNILQLRLLGVKNATEQNKPATQEKLIGAIQSLLQEKEGISFEEKKQLRFCLAQTLFNLSRPEMAAGVLTDYVTDFAKDAGCKDAYLLLASCYIGKEDTLYTRYAEKALSLSPELEHNSQLHKHLFNSYLRLSEQGAPEAKAAFMEKAAQHLFCVTDGSLSRENQQWLAGYYLKQGNDSKKAILVLENLLKIRGQKPLISLHVEAETLKLALLYKEQGRLLDSASTLEALTQEQRLLSDAEWKYARMAQFELAKVYSLLGKSEQAIEIYQNLISSSSHLSSYFSLAAQLELTKLQLLELNAKSLSGQEDAFLPLCDQLKELAIKRQLYSEPLHTEASLLYATIQSQLCDKALKNEKKCLLLEQTKQELLSFQDTQFAQFPEKKELINQYLSYIETELSCLKGQPPQKTEEQLHELLSHVCDEALKERVVKSLEELDRRL